MPSYVVNGEHRDLESPLTIAVLLDDMALTGRKIAVEKNGAIVPRSCHAEEKITDGDTIEIVTAVGGG